MKKFSLTLHPILPYLFSFLLIFVVNSLERIIYITSSYSFLKPLTSGNYHITHHLHCPLEPLLAKIINNSLFLSPMVPFI